MFFLVTPLFFLQMENCVKPFSFRVKNPANWETVTLWIEGFIVNRPLMLYLLISQGLCEVHLSLQGGHAGAQTVMNVRNDLIYYYFCLIVCCWSCWCAEHFCYLSDHHESLAMCVQVPDWMSSSLLVLTPITYQWNLLRCSTLVSTAEMKEKKNWITKIKTWSKKKNIRTYFKN